MKHPRLPSRGAALLAALLVVSLVAMLAAGAAWQQWRTVEIESMERQQSQARWLLLGALDWARLILREDDRSGNANAPTDHLAEPWAIPLQEARLSTFLSGNAEDNLAQQVFLSGQIKDLQARLNVANLLQGDQIDSPTWQAFARLFDVLGLPPTQLARLTQGLLAAQQSKEGTSTPMPQRVSQLAWLGVTPATLQTLAPYITLLPVRTPVNLNTASPLVLYASVPGLSLSDAQRLSEQRNQNPWSSLNAFQTAADHPISLEGTHSVYTRFFEVTGRLRMPATTLEERSVVQRDPTDVKVLWRETGSLQ